VWIYASTWKNDWKKDVQELCYKATATGLPASFMGGMPCGTARGPMMAAAMGLPMGMQAGMGLGGMACPGMPVMGCASGLFGAPAGVFPNMLGPACPAMMDGAPISWSHRPLPVLTDRQPAAQTTASAAAAAALAAAPPVATSRPIPAV
jgi:hypothetical protein